MEERDDARAHRKRRGRQPGPSARSREDDGRRRGRERNEEENGEKEGEERPRNLRFHLVARACPSRFEILILARASRGWGPRETRPPAGSEGPVTLPLPFCSLSLSLSLSLSFHRLFLLVFYRSPVKRSYSGGDSSTGPCRIPRRAASNPFRTNAPLYSIPALCLSNPVILASDYAVRISVGYKNPPRQNSTCRSEKQSILRSNGFDWFGIGTWNLKRSNY